MHKARAIALIALTLAVTMFVGPATNAQGPETSKGAQKGKMSSKANKPATKDVAAKTGLPAPVKLCSAIVPGNWRDTIAVPDTWTVGACQTFAETVIATHYQLGCADGNGIAWGGYNNANAPAGNSCKW